MYVIETDDLQGSVASVTDETVTETASYSYGTYGTRITEAGTDDEKNLKIIGSTMHLLHGTYEHDICQNPFAKQIMHGF